MADELRWEAMVVSVPDGTTLENAGSTFRNTTDATMFIRKVRINATMSGASPNETCTFQWSKSRTIVLGNNEPGLNIQTQLAMPSQTFNASPPEDGALAINQLLQFAKGEITLEPNEAVFVNTTKTSGGAADATHNVGYHF